MRYEIKYSETIYRNFLAEKIAKELVTLGKSLLSVVQNLDNILQ